MGKSEYKPTDRRQGGPGSAPYLLTAVQPGRREPRGPSGAGGRGGADHARAGGAALPPPDSRHCLPPPRRPPARGASSSAAAAGAGDGFVGAEHLWKGCFPVGRGVWLLSQVASPRGVPAARIPTSWPWATQAAPCKAPRMFLAAGQVGITRRRTGQFLPWDPGSSGENMPRPPECLLRLLRGTPRQRVCTLFIISFKFTFFVSVMIYWHIVGEPRGQREFSNLPADVPCPRLVPPALLSSTPPPGNIFFLETSDRTNPNFLFMCSVESAARAHPESRVVVLMKGLPGGNASLPRHLGLSLLGCFPNVHLRPLDLEELFRDTPLAAWFEARRHRWEPYALPVLSDASRIALLWKFGGIYLDTDFIVLRNLQNLTNTLGTQSRYVLNGAFLAFERRHEFLALCMRDFVAHYNGWIWGHQGPQLLTRVFKKWCSIRSLDESHACRGVTALPCEAFYPVPWQDWKKYFQEVHPDELQRLLKATYAVHVWNKKSQGTRLEATSRALLAQLHARYCPTTHEAMKMYL